MHVKLLNGERGVAALIVNDGVSYINLEYERGAMTGDVERVNKYGRNELKGHVVDGVEDGLFIGNDDNAKVVWRWYYRNGERYSEVVESGELDGYYDVKSVSIGLVLSTRTCTTHDLTHHQYASYRSTTHSLRRLYPLAYPPVE